MSDSIRAAITTLQDELRKQNEAVSETKRTINRLCKSISEPPIFADADLADAESGSLGIARDKWYGQAVATAIREYLLMRRAAKQGPATVAEIHAALKSGGFQFDAKDDENAKRGIRISLTKNTALFHRLPDGSNYGLTEWYPEIRPKKERRQGDQQAAVTDDAPDGTEGGDAE